MYSEVASHAHYYYINIVGIIVVIFKIIHNVIYNHIHIYIPRDVINVLLHELQMLMKTVAAAPVFDAVFRMKIRRLR